MQQTLTASQLCSANSSSFCVTPFQLWPSLPNSSQTISALLIKVVPSLPTSAQLFSPLPCSCQLFSTTHLCPPRLNSSQLFSTPLNSYHLFLSSSQLFSPSQLWPTLLDSSHLLSQICLHTEQAFPRRSIYIYPTLLYSWLHDLLRHMPTGH